MKIHCVYCGSRLTVTTIRFDLAPKAEQQKRLIFEQEHEQTCGPRPISMILEMGPHA